jgi:hypothetical protein
MKNKLLFASILSLFFSGLISMAQESSELNLSLQEAQEFAIQHNKMVISAKLDAKASKAMLWETISMGLPQISSSAGITDNLKQMVFLIPDLKIKYQLQWDRNIMRLLVCRQACYYLMPLIILESKLQNSQERLQKPMLRILNWTYVKL